MFLTLALYWRYTKWPQYNRANVWPRQICTKTCTILLYNLIILYFIRDFMSANSILLSTFEEYVNLLLNTKLTIVTWTSFVFCCQTKQTNWPVICHVNKAGRREHGKKICQPGQSSIHLRLHFVYSVNG